MRSEKEQIVKIDGYELKLTNLDKVFWPKEGYTKRDLVYYYYKVSNYILPHLKERPLTLERYPNGIKGESFFQKNAAYETPEWVKTRRIYSPSANEEINYIICNNRATLIYLANLAVISQNPWLSHWPTLDNPDFFTLDLDPHPQASFDDVIEVARIIKAELDNFGLKSWVKTSGASGLHIYVPVKPIYSYKQVRTFAELIAVKASKKNPRMATIERVVERRGGRVYIDYLQNIKSKTLASVYSVRAIDGAWVSTPLSWDELRPGLRPKQFNMVNLFERLKQKGDIFAPVLQTPQDLGKALLVFK